MKADGCPESAVGRLLMKRGETLAVAESLTGGGLGERITRVPGSSGWFLLEGRGGLRRGSQEAPVGSAGIPFAEARGRFHRVRPRHGGGSAAVVGSGLGIERDGRRWPGGRRAGKPAGPVFAALAGPGVRRAWKLRIPAAGRASGGGKPSAGRWRDSAGRSRKSEGRSSTGEGSVAVLYVPDLVSVLPVDDFPYQPRRQSQRPCLSFFRSHLRMLPSFFSRADRLASSRPGRPRRE